MFLFYPSDVLLLMKFIHSKFFFLFSVVWWECSDFSSLLNLVLSGTVLIRGGGCASDLDLNISFICTCE